MLVYLLTKAALKGSDHLDFILDHRLYKLQSTKEMEDIYQQIAPKLLHSFVFVTRTQLDEGSAPEEKMILDEGSHTVVAKSLEVPALATEVERAVWQVHQALEKEVKQEPGQPLKTGVTGESQVMVNEKNEHLKK